MEKKNIIRSIIEKFNNSFVSIMITAIYDKISVLQNKYSLQKDKQIGKIIVLSSPKVFDKGYDATDVHKQNPFPRLQVDKFISKMEQNVSDEHLATMYNNFHSLRISEDDMFLIFMTFIKRFQTGSKSLLVGGIYNSLTNKIIAYSPWGNTYTLKMFKKEMDSDTANLEGEYTHEFLHMSSTVNRKNKICTGFNHIYMAPYVNFSIGNGLNEGYTDLLNERIFGVHNNGGLYEMYKIVSEIIEDIVGKDEMIRLYFKADLKGLISRLSEYCNESEIKKFLLNLDDFYKKPELFIDIVEFIYKTYNKMVNNSNSGNIAEEKEKDTDFSKKIYKLVTVYEEWSTRNGKYSNLEVIANITNITDEKDFYENKHTR